MVENIEAYSRHITRLMRYNMRKYHPKTPQLNGLVERMNRIIAEKVKCMISHSKLPKTFWGEAVKTAINLINLSPSRPLNGKIPEEV